MVRFLRKNLGLLGLLITAFLFLTNATPVFALTTADVTVNATPNYVSISVSPTVYAFGAVNTATAYNTTTNYFTVTNGSNIVTNTTIKVTGDWTSAGVGWTASDTGAGGVNTAGLFAYSPDTTKWDCIVKKSAAFNNLVASKAATTNYDFGLGLNTPTSFTDGQINTNVVRLTMAAS